MELNKVKSKVEKLAKSKGIEVQSAWDIFFFENFLYRLSLSRFASSFVFKGGFYLQSIVGAESRTTMDIDLKLLKNELDENELLSIIKEICESRQDEIIYSIQKIADISTATKYGGKTIKIAAKFFNIRKTFSIDIGVGDIVTPTPIEYSYPSNFVEENYSLLAYTIETIMAEKFETLISKGVDNSRSKDLLDLYILSRLHFDEDILNTAFVNTFYIRNTKYDRSYIRKELNTVFQSKSVRQLFEQYASKHSFARAVRFDDCQEAIYRIFNMLHFIPKISLEKYGVEIHMIRHGQDEEDKLGGWSSNHLTQKGIEEVEQLLEIIDTDYDLFISSDLNRAKETAKNLNQKLKMVISYSNEFREANNGDLANLTKTAFKEKYPGLYYSSLRMDEHYPNGESPKEFYERVRKAFINLLENNRNKKILLVTHGGPITVILSLINGFEYSNKLKIAPETGSLTILK